jgi:Phosphopantothenoylcysteine synthetase/decarboxylase
MLENKTVIIGVTGGIAAYKIPYLVSHLVKEGAEVHVIMTKNACNFISPLTFETLTGQQCVVDTFDRSHGYDVEHGI